MGRDSAELLRDIGWLLQRSHALEETLWNVVRLVARWMRASACSIYLLDEDGETLVLQATKGLNPEAIGRIRIRVGQGIAGACLSARRPIAVEDAELDPRVLVFPESGEKRYRGLLAVPLVVRGLPVGVLTVRTARRRVFPREQIELLEMIAAQVGSIVLNARLLDRAARAEAERTHEAEPAEEARNRARRSGSTDAGEGRSERSGLVLRGIANAPGFALGHVHFHVPTLDLGRVEYEPSRSKRAEQRALARALRETIRQLANLRSEAGSRLGEPFADVFTAHIMILEDHGFRARLVARVEEHGNGVRALVEVMREYQALFASAKDPAIRERAIDLEDVVRRAVGELVGVRQHNPPLRDGVIVVAETISPSDFALLQTEKIAGIATVHGGPTSHAAIFARSLEIPAVTGLSHLLDAVRPDDEIIVDGVEGIVVVNPTPAQLADHRQHVARFERYRERFVQRSALPSETLDGTVIRLSANIGGPNDVEILRRYGACGVGLFRTEMLVLSQRGFPDEDEQVRIYQRVAEDLAPEVVVVRTFDLGGDKALPGETVREANPQLGWRSIRLLLDRPDVFRAQVRAILRANTKGNLRILLPMVTSVEELEASRVLVDDAQRELGDREPTPLGVMIETPAAVAVADHLARRCDFFSIGTNDLVQYTLATDRENERVASLYDPFHPAVLRQIRLVTAAAEKAGIPCSVCGEFAANPLAVPILIGMGVRELSMSPFNMLVVRRMVRAMRDGAVRALAAEVAACASGSDVRIELRRALAGLGLLEDRVLGGYLQQLLAPRLVDRGGGRR